MTNSSSKISVIIPAYNAGKFISKTLNSVFSQSLIPHEVIVVDDGSTDNTSEVIKQFDAKYSYQKNQGTAGALNHGVQLATGNVYAFLDHDDIWQPNKLLLQNKVLESKPEVDMVFTLLENIIVNETLEDLVDVDLGPVNGIHKSTFMVRETSFRKIGQFSTSCGTQEFLNWFSHALEQGLKAHTVQEVLVSRTIHGSNQTILNKEMKNDFPKVIKSILDRRRKI
ncbi:glycosyltransferase family A protein [Ekhidna sp. To15]|uniref:glycosyltransferase family A protein n=1 Tax=Ekhidna sp. To15 TaxID=3395267 RepID=UPI003F51D69E